MAAGRWELRTFTGRNMEDSSKMDGRGDRIAVFGPFRYDFAGGRLMRGEAEVALPPRGHAVLQLLLERAGTLVDKRTLMASAWSDTSVTDGSVSEAIRLVRRALDDEAGPAALIETVPRRGYRFAAAVSWQFRPAARRQRRTSLRIPWLVAAGAAMIAVGWWAFPGDGTRGNGPGARFTVDVTGQGHIHLKGQPSVAVSRDGTRLAMVLERDGVRRLFVRSLDESAADALAGTEGAIAPFFSPDGATLAFFADGRLKTVAVVTGALRDVAAAPDPHGGVWTPDAAIVFASSGRLQRIVPDGSHPRELVEPAGWEWRWPDILTDGRIIATRWRGTLEAADVAAIDNAGSIAPFIDGASHARASGGDEVYFAREGRIFKAPVTGAPSPRPVSVSAERVATDPLTGAAQFAASGAGVLVYVGGDSEVVARRVLQWLDDDGGEKEVAFGPARVKTARLAPDERRMAVTLADGAATDVWIAGPEPHGLKRLSHDGRSTGGVWSPDGRHIAFSRSVDGRFVAMIAAVAGGAPRVLWSNGDSTFPYSWAPSGRAVAVETHRTGTGWDVDLLAVDLEGGQIAARALLAGAADERFPRFSPNGLWIAYQSNASGRWEVYIAQADGQRARLVSRQGGEQPIWHGPDRLLYTADGLLWAVDLKLEPGRPRASGARPLLRLDDRIVAEASRNGLLALARAPGAIAPGVHVVLGGAR
jgi:DNA-binding winged helix-turn-helix (wHTH) protein/Tol biopolymer transport system component